MTWSFVVPGQPVSTNHMYIIGKGYRRGGISFPKMVKAPGVENYQTVASMVCRIAKPKDWKWDGELLVVEFDFHLMDNIDCDNAMKALLDAIKDVIGVDDRFMLPRAMTKEWGLKPVNARVEVRVG
jgi:hypothetical protein